MTFTTPLAFVFFLALPLIFYIGWPRQRYRRARDISSLILRSAIITLLVLALAGVQVVQSADRLAVIFLIDTSDSVGPVAVDNALARVRETLTQMGPDDEVGIVLFGGDAQVEHPVSPTRELAPLRSSPDTGNTDIAGAIRLALAMFPANTARRIVVMSDGYPTLGDAEAAAQLAAVSGVQISYLPIEREAGPEVRVTNFDAPSSVPEGQPFDLNVTIVSDIDTAARIIVLAGGREIRRDDVNLRAGTNNRTITIEGVASGFRDFDFIIEPQEGDVFYQNNSLATFSQVVGSPRVLIVGGTEEETRYLVPALQEIGLQVDQTAVDGLPTSVAALEQYDTIVLANVSATPLSTRRMQALQAYVRDLGGGLVAIGGPQSFGPGGYFDTPLEDMLPIDMQLKDQERLPKLTIVYVIDRSGSMGATTADGVPRIELAKEAINRSVDLLQPTDRAALASFDAVAYWMAEFQDVRDKAEFKRFVGSLRPSGGTDILSGMQLVAKDIVNEDSDVKHIILLTDGESDPTGLVELTRSLREDEGVTTTTISVGAPAQLLRDMASAGGGNYYVTQDINSIPTIFAQETVLVTRAYIFEDPFVPVLTARSPIMEGIDALPQLRGYVGATPKLASQIILRGPEPYRDPILAAWQYGLGRSVAFTSDATARWGADWVSWENYSRFWSQVIGWTMTEGGSENLETRVVMEGKQARVIVDARDGDGAFLNGLDLLASVVDPELGNRRVSLHQVAPGRYEAVFTPQREGAYLVRIASAEGEVTQVNDTTGWVMGYSPEYLHTGNEDSVLPALAEITGGKRITDDLRGVFDRDIDAKDATAPLWPWMLLVAVVLLPFDIAVRRLIVTRTDLQRARAAISARLRPAHAGEVPLERVSTLLEARDRARQRSQVEEEAAPTSTIGALRSRRERPQPKAETPPVTVKTPVEEQKPRFTPPTAGTSGENLGSRLLKKRRERDDE